MTAPISQTAFRGPRDIFVSGPLAQLRLATRLPLRVSCQCRALSTPGNRLGRMH